jgi:hypothetical protein
VGSLSYEAVLVRCVSQADGDPVVPGVGELTLGDLRLCLGVASVLQEAIFPRRDAVTRFIAAITK